MTSLAIFDLAGTLLDGDGDEAWCLFLIGQGQVDAGRAARALTLAAQLREGTVDPIAYGRFQAELLAGLNRAQLQPLRHRFLDEVLRPRIPAAARALLRRHREQGDTLVLATAANRVVTESLARELGADVLLCTELQWQRGRCTGRVAGSLNLRTAKVDRLRAWLAEQGLTDAALKGASAYSASINDLALLSVVGRPVVVDPEPRLAITAMRKGWSTMHLRQVVGGACAA